jgi:hypothetical protein
MCRSWCLLYLRGPILVSFEPSLTPVIIEGVGMAKSYLVERPKHWSAAECLTVASKYLSCCFGAVYYDDRLVAQLDLVDISVHLTPLAVLFGCIVLDVRNVSYNWPVSRSWEVLQPYGPASILIYKEVNGRSEEDGDYCGAERVFSKLVLKKRSDDGNHADVAYFKRRGELRGGLIKMRNKTMRNGVLEEDAALGISRTTILKSDRHVNEYNHTFGSNQANFQLFTVVASGEGHLPMYTANQGTMSGIWDQHAGRHVGGAECAEEFRVRNIEI